MRPAYLTRAGVAGHAEPIARGNLGAGDGFRPGVFAADATFVPVDQRPRRVLGHDLPERVRQARIGLEPHRQEIAHRPARTGDDEAVHVASLRGPVEAREIPHARPGSPVRVALASGTPEPVTGEQAFPQRRGHRRACRDEEHAAAGSAATSPPAPAPPVHPTSTCRGTSTIVDVMPASFNYLRCRCRGLAGGAAACALHRAGQEPLTRLTAQGDRQHGWLSEAAWSGQDGERSRRGTAHCALLWGSRRCQTGR